MSEQRYLRFLRSLPCLGVEKDKEDGSNGWQFFCVAVGKLEMERLPSSSFGS